MISETFPYSKAFEYEKVTKIGTSNMIMTNTKIRISHLYLFRIVSSVASCYWSLSSIINFTCCNRIVIIAPMSSIATPARIAQINASFVRYQANNYNANYKGLEIKTTQASM